MTSTRHKAFTLTELLVVIIIMVILATIAVPGFRAMIESTESSRAQTGLRSAVRLARAAAVRSGSGEDVALVFMYTPGPLRGEGGGRTLLVPCLKVGQVRDSVGGDEVLRDVFVPMRASEPIQLPQGWMVRAYVPRNTMRGSAWYVDGVYADSAEFGNWVFPETGFFDKSEEEENGLKRQTFMIRFAGGTGNLLTGGEDAIVLDPVMDAEWTRPTTENLKWKNPEMHEDLGEFVRGVLRRANPKERAAILGDKATDTILVRPVTQVALYDEAKLASGIRGKIDPATGCIYALDQQTLKLTAAGSTALNGNMVNNWIYGDTNLNNMMEAVDDAGQGDSPQAVLYVIDPHRGVPLAVDVQPEAQ